MFYEVPSKLQNTSCETSSFYSQSDKSVLKEEKDISTDSSEVNPVLKKESDVASASESSSTIEKTTKANIEVEANSSITPVSETNSANCESSKPESECAIVHSEPSSEAFPHDSETSQTSTFS